METRPPLGYPKPFKRLLREYLEGNPQTVDLVREPAFLARIRAGVGRSPLKVIHLPQERTGRGGKVRLQESGHGVEQRFVVRADQRVADAQIAEERQRLSFSRSDEPERQPRQLDSQRVEIDAVDAALRDEPAQVRERELAIVRRIGSDRLGQELGRADEKVAASDRRVEDLDVEQRLERVLACQFPSPDFRRPSRDQRVENALDDCVDHRLWREVRARLVTARRLSEYEAPVALHELPRKQAFVDRPERADREILVVDEFAADAVDTVKRPTEGIVGNRATLEPRVLCRVEEAAVVLGYSERLVAAVDHPEERAKLGEKLVARRGEMPPLIDKGGKLQTMLRDRIPSVIGVFDRQKSARLGEEAKEHPVQEDECVGERLVERLSRAGFPCEQPLRNRRDSSKNRALERVRNLDRVERAVVEGPLQERPAVGAGDEGMTAEEGDEVAQIRW